MNHLHFRICTSCLTLAALAMPILADDPGPFQITKDARTISVRRSETPVFDYRFAETTYKCYVERLFTPSGTNILRDSPHDHVHHHALMFAIAVDDEDFWAEFPNVQQGSQVHRREQTFSKPLSGGVQTAGFTAQVDWMPNKTSTIMTEERTVQTFQAEDMKPTLLSWSGRFSPAGDRAQVVWSGRHYFGLGLRFIESMDRVGRFFNASGDEGHVVRGEERLTRTKWVAYTAPADGKTITVAVFDHPDNIRHPATMFTMPSGFAYISATLNLKEEPLTVKAGEPLLLRYGVALWDGEVQASEVDEVYARWAKLVSE